MNNFPANITVMVKINFIRFSPSEIIVPIFGYEKNKDKWLFLGSGFFFGKPPLLATASHVVEKKFDKVAIYIFEENKFYYASAVTGKPEIDLAILKIEKYEPPSICQLGCDEQIVFTKPIYCYEYGTTLNIGSKIAISPATRMGNITRLLDKRDTYGLAGKDMLELSFPALKGASGSPVVSIEEELILLGIVVGNVSYHLMPAQIETILDQNNEYLEEVKYLMPQALAVNVKHLNKFYQDIKGQI